jgi:PrtD family type I secretion system ABC transporter
VVTVSASGNTGRAPNLLRAALRANKPLFVAAFGFSCVMSVLALTVSFYMLQIYDRVLSSRSGETLFLLTIMAAVGVAVFAALDTLRARLLARIGYRVAESIGAEVLRAMVSTSALGGGPAARSGLRDVETLRGFIASPSFAALIDSPFLILFLVFLYWLHPAFFLLVVLGGALLVALALASEVLTGQRTTQALSTLAQAHGFVEDGLRNADALEGMGMSHAFVTRWHRTWVRSASLAVDAFDRESLVSGLSKTVRLLIQIGLLGTGAVLVLDMQSSGGVMIAASIIGSRALAPIEAGVGAWRSIIAVRLAASRLSRLLEHAPKRDSAMALPAPKGALTVQQASFRTPGRSKPILANISFALQPGESLGIIGPSASGKSTLLRLLVGAWPCSAGLVRLDGADIYSWPRQELGRYIGYLPQDVELFSGTVRDNIARLSDGTPDEIVNAAQAAHAHEMILALPKGYDTEIGQGGHNLSGGQRQRIGLARALYGQPRLVVLDEPNANLDALGEEALMAALANLRKQGVTIIVVAHRPALLSGMDKLAVLGEGTLEGFGPREEVMKRYARGPGARPAQGNVVQMPGPLAGAEAPAQGS